MAMTDPIKRALRLRETLVKENKVLVADFKETLQGKDTSKVVDLMPVIDTQYYPFRTKVNIKEIDPIASKKYDVDFFDMSKKTEQEIESFVKKQEFDFPLWYKHESQFSMKKIHHYNLPFILQVAGCNFHDGSSLGGCWYCFVDDKSNDGILGENKIMLGIDETIDSMISAKEKIKKQYNDSGYDMDIKVLRTSGGEPTIALDWILNLWREVDKRGLDFVGQLDSNLSTAKVVEEFEDKGIFEKNILEKLAEYPVKVLTALKGVDDNNLQNNVQSKTSLKDQEYSLKRFVEAGFDIYPQMYNPDPSSLRQYLERIDSVIENIALKIHIGPIKVYGPNSSRLSSKAHEQGVDPKGFIEQKKKQWDCNYNDSCEVLDKYLKDKYGIGYKQTSRSDIEVKVK